MFGDENHQPYSDDERDYYDGDDNVGRDYYDDDNADDVDNIDANEVDDEGENGDYYDGDEDADKDYDDGNVDDVDVDDDNDNFDDVRTDEVDDERENGEYLEEANGWGRGRGRRPWGRRPWGRRPWRPRPWRRRVVISIIARGEEVRIAFTSDGSGTRRGFRAWFRVQRREYKCNAMQYNTTQHNTT